MAYGNRIFVFQDVKFWRNGMIVSRRLHGYHVHSRQPDDRYLSVFDDFMHGKISIIKVMRSNYKTKVWLIDTDWGKFVLKIFVPKQKKLERVIKSIFKRNYYVQLIRQINRVRKRGLNAPNDFYLLATKKTFNYVSTYIMLVEYIEGTELWNMPEITDELKQDAKQLIDELHQHDMISGDTNGGNFFVTDQGLRIIDLSGKNCNFIRRAEDRIDLEKRLGIQNTQKDLGYYIVTWRTNIRAYLKEFRMRLKSRADSISH
ncbi:lipopolysaccharide core heptose(II) kinase RfaY [Limnobaculum zhutongyuii]|nr:lipopolysaccharide core heptose(II) kinase RfaY [Limnobaculum zhutongyuii]